MFRFKIGQKVWVSSHESGIVLDGHCDVVQGRRYVTYVLQMGCGLVVRFCEENLRPGPEMNSPHGWTV